MKKIRIQIQLQKRKNAKNDTIYAVATNGSLLYFSIRKTQNNASVYDRLNQVQTMNTEENNTQLPQSSVSDSVLFANELILIREEKLNICKKENTCISNFISKHRQYKDGQRVKIILINKEVVCFILSCGVHDNGDIFYRFLQSKKDGTPSKNRYYPNYYANEFTIVVL